MTTEPKLSPCACSWCGKLPEYTPDKTSVYHPIGTCTHKALGAYFIEGWNSEHQEILARRKADFIDGARANGIGNRGPTKEMIEKLFELYLAKEREK